MDAVIIRIIDLPYKVKGLTVKDENDDYNIYINSKLSNDARINTLRHEIEHIKKGHFYSFLPIEEIEADVNQQVKPL